MSVLKMQTLFPLARNALASGVRRNFGACPVIAQKATDPIQNLFAEKVKEYGQKRKSSGGKPADLTPDMEKDYQEEYARLEKQFGGGKGIDLTKFPTFKFEDPTIDPINLEKK